MFLGGQAPLRGREGRGKGRVLMPSTQYYDN